LPTPPRSLQTSTQRRAMAAAAPLPTIHQACKSTLPRTAAAAAVALFTDQMVQQGRLAMTISVISTWSRARLRTPLLRWPALQPRGAALPGPAPGRATPAGDKPSVQPAERAEGEHLGEGAAAARLIYEAWREQSATDDGAMSGCKSSPGVTAAAQDTVPAEGEGDQACGTEAAQPRNGESSSCENEGGGSGGGGGNEGIIWRTVRGLRG
jgi:hypothetical protein